MLALLVPWCAIGTIHHQSPTLEVGFYKFLEKATPDQLAFMENVQYFYESSDRISQWRKDEHAIEAVELKDLFVDESEEGQTWMEDYEELMVTEDNIEYAILHPFGPEETTFTQVEMNITTDISIFLEGPISLPPGVLWKGIT